MQGLPPVVKNQTYEKKKITKDEYDEMMLALKTDENYLGMAWLAVAFNIGARRSEIVQFKTSLLSKEWIGEGSGKYIFRDTDFHVTTAKGEARSVEKSFDKIMGYINNAKKSDKITVISGGNGDKSKGYFVEPTIIVTTNPHYVTMETELFGPILTLYVYEDDQWEATLKLVDTTSEYALTGAVFSQDRYAIEEATIALQNAAGNFYIKCSVCLD